jgi:hypothetical protein
MQKYNISFCGDVKWLLLIHKFTMLTENILPITAEKIPTFAVIF